VYVTWLPIPISNQLSDTQKILTLHHRHLFSITFLSNLYIYTRTPAGALQVSWSVSGVYRNWPTESLTHHFSACLITWFSAYHIEKITLCGSPLYIQHRDPKPSCEDIPQRPNWKSNLGIWLDGYLEVHYSLSHCFTPNTAMEQNKIFSENLYLFAGGIWSRHKSRLRVSYFNRRRP